MSILRDTQIDIEICIDSVESAIAAERGGAQRVELCSALSEGGITPSSGLIRCVCESIALPVFVIIRPRGGNFVYSDKELAVMQRDIRDAQLFGVAGVVLGVLTRAQRIDVAQSRLLAELARPLSVTFHRAFDVCPDQVQALRDVIACGADRVLTSGGAPDALRGADQIARLRDVAGDRIRIMAGGGVRASNAASIVQRSGIRDLHTSLKGIPEAAQESAPSYLAPNAPSPYIVREEDVRAFKAALDPLPTRPSV